MTKRAKLFEQLWARMSLRQTLFLGAGFGILLPAVLLAYFQISSKLESEVELRVRAPMQQYSEVLSRGIALAIWNVDRLVVEELVESVMRNPDVLSVTVTDEHGEVFFRKQNEVARKGAVMRDERAVTYNGVRVGRLAIELTSARIQDEFHQNLQGIILAVLAQVLISFAVIWLLFDRRLIQPLQQLRAGASRLARGDLDQPMQLNRQDELGELASGLDKMRTDLGALLSERQQQNASLQHELTERRRVEDALGVSQATLLSLNATLEQRVTSRTQELSTAVERLTAAQAELVRTEKMAALGSLVAGVAHELNTPIGNSLTVASTMQDQTRQFAVEMTHGLKRSRLDEFVASTAEGAGILMRGLRHAADLVSSFKQVAVDQTSVNRRNFDLLDTVNEILLTLGPSIRKTGHSVHCQVAPAITMDSYPGPLGQVLTNLINNALIHAFHDAQHGQITINAELQGEGRICLIVQDSGTGISPEHLGRVFDPFFTTKLGKGGSGLGLNIAYNLVRDVLGGTITVSNTQGQGACFSLMLPLEAPVNDAPV
jgi:signal transduction histidine kinase